MRFPDKPVLDKSDVTEYNSCGVKLPWIFDFNNLMVFASLYSQTAMFFIAQEPDLNYRGWFQFLVNFKYRTIQELKHTQCI